MALLDFISGAANVLGSALGVVSQDSANKTNLQIARETNQQQRELFEKQLQYQTSEREVTQAYNTPAAQRARFEEAGFNPYMMMSNTENGNVSMQSAPSAPSQHVAAVQPLSYGEIARSLGDSLAQSSSIESLNLDNQSKRIDLQFKTAKEILSLENQRSEIYAKKVQTDLDKKRLSELDENIAMLRENLDILRSTKPELKKQAIAQTKAAELQNEYQKLQNDYQSAFNDLQNKLTPHQIQLIKAQVFQAIQSGNDSAASSALKKIEGQGIKIDNFQKNKINWLIREGVMLDNKRKRFEMRYPTFPQKLFGLGGYHDEVERRAYNYAFPQSGGVR